VRRRELLLPPVVGAVGLVVLLIGTFLPWLRSGRNGRNSYQAGGTVRRLIGTTGLVDSLLALWPLVGLACAAVVALYLLSLRGLATVLAGLTALAAGAAAIGALATTATSYAQVAIVGPSVTLSGATFVALAVLLRALSAVAVPRSPQ
jgi:hypothetical protein